VARLNTLRLRLALALFLVAAAALGVHAGLTRWPLPQFLATLQAGNPAPIVAPAAGIVLGARGPASEISLSPASEPSSTLPAGNWLACST